MAAPSCKTIIETQEQMSQAVDMAIRALKARGIIDPMLMPNGKLATIVESDMYNQLFATERMRFFNMLTRKNDMFIAKRETREIDPGVNFYDREEQTAA